MRASALPLPSRFYPRGHEIASAFLRHPQRGPSAVESFPSYEAEMNSPITVRYYNVDFTQKWESLSSTNILFLFIIGKKIDHGTQSSQRIKNNACLAKRQTNNPHSTMNKQKNFPSQDAAQLAFKEVQDEIEQVNFSFFGCGGWLFVVLSCLHVAKQKRETERKSASLPFPLPFSIGIFYGVFIGSFSPPPLSSRPRRNHCLVNGRL